MEASLRSIQLWYDAGRVISTEFLVADAARPGPHGIVGGFEGDGPEAGRVVGADWGGNEEEEGRARGAHTQGTLGSDHCGAEVEGVASFAGTEIFRSTRFIWDEVVIHTQE